MIQIPSVKNISLRIEPNYSSWQTIELSYQFTKDAIDRGIEGDVVECGVACGNNFAAMCLAGRKGWGFDSFEGIPWATEEDDCQPGFEGGKTSNTGLSSSGVTVHSLEDAQINMKRWGITDYEFVKGWFQNTIKKKARKIKKISVLRLDGDLYESTLIPLQYLYPKLSKGGILIIDDWNLKGCQQAFFNYFLEHKQPTKVFECGNPVYFQK